MSRDWLGRPRESGLRALIARRHFDAAIELLRAQVEGRAASQQTRMQLADVLVMSGRPAEACQVFLGLVDEFAASGFTAKAVALLKRVERIEPGRVDVRERLLSLVGPGRGVVAPADGGPVSEGLEPSTEGPVPSAEPPPPIEAPEATHEGTDPMPPAGPAQVQEPSEPWPSAVRPQAPPALADTGEGPIPGDAAPAPHREAVSLRIRGVFRKFLESISVEPHGAVALAGAPAVTTLPTEAVSSALGAVRGALEREDVTAAVPVVGGLEPVDKFADAAPPTDARRVEEPHEETARVGQRLRDVLQRLLSPFAPGAEPEAAPQGDGMPPPPTESGAAGEPAASAPSVGEYEEFDLGTGEPVALPSRADLAPEPYARGAEAPEAEGQPDAVEPGARGADAMSEVEFQERILDVIEEIVKRPSAEALSQAGAAGPEGSRPAPTPARSVLGSPLLEGLSDEELLSVVHGLELKTYLPGDIVVTEGEPGQSLFVIASGSVKVCLRGAEGRNLEVRRLGEGEFFGEISSISGRPRTATVTAAGRCELLELDKQRVEQIARKHPRVRERLESRFVDRVTSPETSAVRAVALRRGVARAAQEVMQAAFGDSRLEPRTKLRLADALLRVGRDRDAMALLTGLADDLVRNGFTDKAIAVLKKIERIRKRHFEELPLAPLVRERHEVRAAPADPAEEPAARPPGRRPPLTAAFFRGWLQDVLRERLQRAQPQPTARMPLAPDRVSGYARGLKASPLFEGFSDDALLAVIRGLRLLSFEAGDVIITEGETGESLFVLVSGSVKVAVRDPGGHDVPLCLLSEGQFFGEMSAISHRPRTATVTAASDCELLELEKPVLESIVVTYPHVRKVLEQFYVERALNPAAAAIRGQPAELPSSPPWDGAVPGSD
jgi:CRP-like cAMP-binding protein